MSFGGRLAQFRAMQACNPSDEPGLPPRNLFCGQCALAGSEHKRAPSPRAGFSRGERAGGVGASGFR